MFDATALVAQSVSLVDLPMGLVLPVGNIDMNMRMWFSLSMISNRYLMTGCVTCGCNSPPPPPDMVCCLGRCHRMQEAPTFVRYCNSLPAKAAVSPHERRLLAEQRRQDAETRAAQHLVKELAQWPDGQADD
jgi:hypothetical protein